MLFVNIALNAPLTSMALSWSAVHFVLSVTLHSALILGRLIMNDLQFLRGFTARSLARLFSKCSLTPVLRSLTYAIMPPLARANPRKGRQALQRPCG